MILFVLISLSISVVYVVRYHRARVAINFHPGFSFLIHPYAFITHFLPTIRYINLNPDGDDYTSQAAYEEFAKAGSTIQAIGGFLPTPYVALEVADAEAIRQIVTKKDCFAKDLDVYQRLKIFGPNLVVMEGHEWKRHRRIVSPAFSELNNTLVWNETTNIVQQWFARMQKTSSTYLERDVAGLTRRIALQVLSAAAFNKRYPFYLDDAGSEQIEPGHRLSWKSAIEGAMVNTTPRIITPVWARTLPIKSIRAVAQYYDEVDQFMDEMIEDRKHTSDKDAPKADLFNALLMASGDESSVLTHAELMGNIYIFLLAGMETTAHTLAFTFALLACYPDVQQKLYQHVLETVGDRQIGYSDYKALNYSLAVFQETLRIMPPVARIPKLAIADTTLPCNVTEHGKTSRKSIPVPKGTPVYLNTGGLHMDPANWDNPTEFRPERFIDTATYRWNRDAFIPFSAGERVCIGRTTSYVEAVAVLSNLVRTYEIRLTPEMEQMPVEHARAQLMKCRSGLTLTPINISLVFKKRS